MLKELDSVPKYHLSNRPDRVAQLVEHWGWYSKGRWFESRCGQANFAACPVWLTLGVASQYYNNTIIIAVIIIFILMPFSITMRCFNSNKKNGFL